MQRLVEVMVVA